MDESHFLRGLHENPEDQDLRREYHEWLNENGNPRSEYMDFMIRREKIAHELTGLDRQLEQLIPKVGKHWITSLYPEPGKNPFPGGYTLNDGREIQISFLQQYFTYGGLIEGLPTDNMNKKKLQRLKDNERARAPGDPYVVPPKCIPVEYRQKEPYPFGIPEKMPSVTCISRWMSRHPTRDDSMDYSQLSIIWFQSDFAFPIDDTVIEHLLDLDWNSLAIDLEI